MSWMLRTSARLFPKTTIKTILKTEADLERKETNQIAKHTIQHPDRRWEFLIFVESMMPMDQLYDGMIDEMINRFLEFMDPVFTKAVSPVLFLIC